MVTTLREKFDNIIPEPSTQIIQTESQDQEQDHSLFLNTISKISYQKWYINITIHSYTISSVALLNLGADMNCIQEGLVPTKYFEKTKESLMAANNHQLNIKYKLPLAHVCNNGVCFSTSFFLIRNLSTPIILGNPFLQLLYPMKVTESEVEIEYLGKPIIFKFTYPIKHRDIQLLKNVLVNQKIQLLSKHISSLQQDLIFRRIMDTLVRPEFIHRVKQFQEKLEKEIYSTFPNTFWDRKKHTMELPYESGFTDKNIPIKARPIQMSSKFVEYCKKEINDLLDKNLIKKSKSPWSCYSFYLNKNVEIERGTPRLVINYKPLNQALKWIRYPIPNKSDLLKRLH